MKTTRYKINFTLPPQCVTVDREILGGKPVLKGTRIPLELIFDLISKGWGIYELPSHFPGIDTSLVEKLVKYHSTQYSTYGSKEKRV